MRHSKAGYHVEQPASSGNFDLGRVVSRMLLAVAVKVQ